MSEFLLLIAVHFWLMYVYFGLGDTLKFLICCFLLFLVIKCSIYSLLELLFFTPDSREAALNSDLILKYFLEISTFSPVFMASC